MTLSQLYRWLLNFWIQIITGATIINLYFAQHYQIPWVSSVAIVIISIGVIYQTIYFFRLSSIIAIIEKMTELMKEIFLSKKNFEKELETKAYLKMIQEI